jgi:hypothetical protein
MGERTTNAAHREKARPLALQHGTATLIASQHPQDAEAVGLGWSAGLDFEPASPVLFGTLTWTGP